MLRDLERDYQDLVWLDVGGTLFHVTRAVLCSGGGSNLLESLCSGRHGNHMHPEWGLLDGTYFLDRYHPSLQGAVQGYVSHSTIRPTTAPCHILSKLMQGPNPLWHHYSVASPSGPAPCVRLGLWGHHEGSCVPEPGSAPVGPGTLQTSPTGTVPCTCLSCPVTPGQGMPHMAGCVGDACNGFQCGTESTVAYRDVYRSIHRVMRISRRISPRYTTWLLVSWRISWRISWGHRWGSTCCSVYWASNISSSSR